MRRAMKYPRRQEVTPIKGKESGKIFKDGIVLMSPKIVVPINFAPKNSTETEKNAIMSDTSMARLKILRVPYLLPKAKSSVTRRVTAVEVPLIAKVDAST